MLNNNSIAAIVQGLDKTGIRHACVGYKYLITCVELILGSQNRTFMVRDIYEDVAEIYGVRWTSVERAIRIAIKKASTDYKKLTNKEFISRIVDQLMD